VVVTLALLTAAVPPLVLDGPATLGITGSQVVVPGAWQPWFVRGLTLLVIACPCAFVISTPVSVVSAITSAAKNGVLIKGGRSLEAMGAAGTDAPIETADVALMGDDIGNLPYLYALSRGASDVIRQNVWSSLGVKALLAVGVPLGSASVALNDWPSSPTDSARSSKPPTTWGTSTFHGRRPSRTWLRPSASTPRRLANTSSAPSATSWPNNCPEWGGRSGPGILVPGHTPRGTSRPAGR